MNLHNCFRSDILGVSPLSVAVLDQSKQPQQSHYSLSSKQETYVALLLLSSHVSRQGHSLQEDKMQGVPLLVLANKQDLINALPAPDVSDLRFRCLQPVQLSGNAF